MKKGIYAVLALCTVFALVLGMGSCGGSSDPKKVTITFDWDGGTYSGTAIKDSVIKINENTSLGDKLPGPDVLKKAGYKLGKGTPNADFVDLENNPVDATTKIKKSTTLKAQWTLDVTQVIVSFDMNLPTGFQGTSFDVNPVGVTSGSAIGSNLPAGPTKDGSDTDLLDFGLKFKGWFDAATGGTEVTAATTFSAAATVYAQWITFDPTTEVAITFNLNYTGAPADIVVIGSKDTPLDTDFPADPERLGTVVGKGTATDTWAFKGWKQYESGSGATYDKTSTFAASQTVYALWEPSTGWPVDDPPAGTDLAGAEKVTLENGFYVVYQFELPAGKAWSDYSGITADYMVGPGTMNKTNSARATRLMGNYGITDFSPVTPNDPTICALPSFYVANYNDGKNAPFIFDDLGSSWSTIANALANWGIEGSAWKWFTLPYKLDGSRKNSGFVAANAPAATATGPFYFGLGLAGNGEGGTTQWIRNVKLIGNTGTTNVNAIPLYVKKTDANNVVQIYPVFTGYNSGSGADGVKEAYRAMVDGSQPTPVDLDTFVPPPQVTITFNANGKTATGMPAPVLVNEGAGLGSLPTAPKSKGFIFKGWFLDQAGTAGQEVIVGSPVFTVDTTVYAKWDARGIVALTDFVYLSDTDPSAVIKIAAKNLTPFTAAWQKASELAFAITLPAGLNIASYDSYSISVNYYEADGTLINTAGITGAVGGLRNSMSQIKFSSNIANYSPDTYDIATVYNLGVYNTPNGVQSSPDQGIVGDHTAFPNEVLVAAADFQGIYIQTAQNFAAYIEITEIIFHAPPPDGEGIAVVIDYDTLADALAPITTKTLSLANGDLTLIVPPALGTYAWKINGIVQGSTTNTLVLSASTYMNKTGTSFLVTVLVTDGDGNIYSQNVTVKVTL